MHLYQHHHPSAIPVPFMNLMIHTNITTQVQPLSLYASCPNQSIFYFNVCSHQGDIRQRDRSCSWEVMLIYISRCIKGQELHLGPKSPWYDLRGWLGVKQQLSIYLSTPQVQLLYLYASTDVYQHHHPSATPVLLCTYTNITTQVQFLSQSINILF